MSWTSRSLATPSTVKRTRRSLMTVLRRRLVTRATMEDASSTTRRLVVPSTSEPSARRYLMPSTAMSGMTTEVTVLDSS